MLQCIVPGDADGLHDHALHWVLCYGYSDGQFQVCDPLSRKITLTEAELEYYMDKNRRLQAMVDQAGSILFLSGHTHVSPNVARGAAEWDDGRMWIRAFDTWKRRPPFFWLFLRNRCSQVFCRERNSNKC